MYDSDETSAVEIMSEMEKLSDNNRSLRLALVAVTFLFVGMVLGYFLAEPLIARRIEDSVDAAVRENMVAIEDTISRALASGELQLAEGALADAVRVALAEQREADRFAALAPLYDGWEDDPYFGPEDASVVMVEFSDFQCGYCGVFANETLPQIRAAYADRVRFIYRDFPIFGELSLWAALGGQCALEQGDFWAFHDALFLRSDEFTDSSFLFALAGELGYDADEFQSCVLETRHIQEVQADYSAAQALGLNGTPGFYVNGEFVSGAQSYETFAAMLDKALAEAEAAADEG